MPLNNFKWENVENIKESFILDYNIEKENRGYVLECDIDYPEKIHDKHNFYPMLPESLLINKQKKLVANL
jgi:hypothetical protein